MALKPVVADIAEVPEAFRSLYVQKDGKHVLDVEGDLPALLAAANGKVVEFRDSKLALLKALGVESPEQALERAKLFGGIDPAKLAKLKDIDPEEYARLKASAAKVGAGSADEMDAKISERIAAALAPVTASNAALKAELDAAKAAASEATRRNVIAAAFAKVGGKPTAADFIVDRAKSVFDVEGDKLKAKADKFSAANPGQPLGLEEWLIGEAKEVPFLFEPSAGGGAVGGNGSGGRTHTGNTFKTTSGSEVKTDGIEVLQ
jgi:hypothetical protein